jgi:type III secretory pathway component EscS
MSKILFLPLWLIRKGFGAIIGIVQIILNLGTGTIKFILRRRLGTILLAIAAIFLGKKILDKNDENKQL